MLELYEYRGDEFVRVGLTPDLWPIDRDDGLTRGEFVRAAQRRRRLDGDRPFSERELRETYDAIVAGTYEPLVYTWEGEGWSSWEQASNANGPGMPPAE